MWLEGKRHVQDERNLEKVGSEGNDPELPWNRLPESKESYGEVNYKPKGRQKPKKTQGMLSECPNELEQHRSQKGGIKQLVMKCVQLFIHLYLANSIPRCLINCAVIKTYIHVESVAYD